LEEEGEEQKERTMRHTIITKIFVSLQSYGKYKLPKHYDNNEVFKAFCVQVG
jgi:hypothetical protein